LARIALAVLLGCIAVCASPVRADDAPPKGDPGGQTTGNKGDVVDGTGKAFAPAEPKPEDKAKDPKKYDSDKKDFDEYTALAEKEPLAVKLADSVGQNRIALNIAWMLITGFLVMFMQAGFALLETGFCRAKNASHTMFMNIGIYCIGIVAFYCTGFAFQMGGTGAVPQIGGTAGLVPATNMLTLHLGGHDWGLLGIHGFFMQGNVYDVGIVGLFLFQMVFMDTGATIPTGAMAERWKLSAFLVYGFFMAGFLYPAFACWAWGGGWLSQIGSNWGLGHGYLDFAGSGVVHAVGGLCGAAGAIVLGPRIGKYNSDGTANAIPAHHIPMATLGALILAFGWFAPAAPWRRPAAATCASPSSPSAPWSRPARPAWLPCSSPGSRTASRTSPWSSTACWPAWWPSPRRAPTSARRAPSTSAPSPVCWWWRRRCSSTRSSTSTTPWAPSRCTRSTACGE
jgi:Amt family ammonium transporter